MLDLLTGGGGILAMLGAAVIALLGAWLHGRSKGKAAVEAKVLRERQEARFKADKVEAAVDARDPSTNRERLKQWHSES